MADKKRFVVEGVDYIATTTCHLVTSALHMMSAEVSVLLSLEILELHVGFHACKASVLAEGAREDN